jgi:hypothetical protein
MGKGKLVFKGDKAKKSKKKNKHSLLDSSSASLSSASSVHAIVGQSQSSLPLTQKHSSSSIDASSSRNNTTTAMPQQPVICKGQGKLTSSGTVLMGIDTKFNSCINVGDAIIVHVPTSSENNDDNETREEMRIITMRLSDTSASISSSFSQDLKIATAFQYISKPKNLQKERDERAKKDRLAKEEVDRNAFGTYKSSGSSGGGQELVYRERTEHGSYRIRREVVDDNVCRSDLLDMRLQKKSDKFC